MPVRESPNGRICSTFFSSILFSFSLENSYFPALFYISLPLSLSLSLFFYSHVDLLTGNIGLIRNIPFFFFFLSPSIGNTYA